MPVKLKDDLYQCEECYKTLKTEEGINKHYYKMHTLPALVKQAEEEIEEIRLTSVSICEVIERLKTVWLSYGLKVSLSSYPTRFSKAVTNTHNAPEGYPTNWRNEGHLPKGYPGWEGDWIGSVEVIDHDRWEYVPGLTDLSGGWSNKGTIPQAKWLHTGSGGGGDNFRYSGMLFIYDFPAMHEQFLASGGEYAVIEHEYKRAIDSFNEEYQRSSNKFVAEHDTTVELFRMQKDLGDAQVKIAKAIKVVSSSLRKEFKETTSGVPPLPDSMFVDSASTAAAFADVIASKQAMPKLDEIRSYVDTLGKKVAKYVKDNPEVFI